MSAAECLHRRSRSRASAVRVALPGDDRPDDPQPGHPGRVPEHRRQLQVHQLQRLLHPLDVLGAEPDQVGPLADVVAQRLGGVVRLEHGREHAEVVEPADPLAVEPVGLRPALDLAGEVGRGHDDLQPGLQEGEEQDVGVRPGRLQGDGGDPALPEPGDEVPQPGGVGGELADRVGAVGGVPRRTPSGCGRRRRSRRRGGRGRGVGGHGPAGSRPGGWRGGAAGGGVRGRVLRAGMAHSRMGG